MQNQEEIKEIYVRYLDKFQGNTDAARKATRLYFEKVNQSQAVQSQPPQQQSTVHPNQEVLASPNEVETYKDNADIGYFESLRNDLSNAWENTKNFVTSDYPAFILGAKNYSDRAAAELLKPVLGKEWGEASDIYLQGQGRDVRAEATRKELETQEKMLPSKSVVGSFREGDYLGSVVGMAGAAPDLARQMAAGMLTKGTSIYAEMLSTEKLTEAQGIAEREGIPLEEAILKGSAGEDPRPYIVTGVVGLLERLGQVKVAKGISNAVRKGTVEVTNKFLKGLSKIESLGWEGITEYLQELVDIGYEDSSKEDHEDATKELQSFLGHMQENYASDRTLDAFWKGVGGSGVLTGAGHLAGSVADKHRKSLDPDKVEVGNLTLTKEEVAQAEAEEDSKYRQSIVEAGDLRDIQKMVQNPVSVDEELARLIQDNDVDDDSASTIRKHELDRLQKLNNLSGSFASIENPNMDDFKNLEEEFKKINSEARDAIESVFSNTKKKKETTTEEVITESVIPKPKGSYNFPIKFITGDNTTSAEKVSKTPVATTNKANPDPSIDDKRDKKITDALDYVFRRTGSMRNKSNPMDRRLDKSRWDKILSTLEMENAPTARLSRLKSYNAYYGEEIQERDPEVYSKIQDIIKTPEAEIGKNDKGNVKKETVSKFPAGMRKSDFDNFDLLSFGIESDAELSRAIRLNQKYGEELSKDETYKDQALSLKDQIASYQKRQKDEFEKTRKASEKIKESIVQPVEDSSEFDSYKNSVNDLIGKIKNATSRDEVNKIVKDNNLESKSKFEPVDIIKFKQAVSDKTSEIAKNRKKEIINKSLEERNEKQNADKGNKQDTDTTKKQGAKLPVESRDEDTGDTKVTEAKNTKKPLDSIVNNVNQYKFKLFSGEKSSGNVSNVVKILKEERTSFFNKNRYSNELEKAKSSLEAVNKKLPTKLSKEELSNNAVKNAQKEMRRLYDEWTSYIESQIKSLEKQGLSLSPEALTTLRALPGMTNIYFGEGNKRGYQLINDLFNSFFDTQTVDENGSGSNNGITWDRLSSKAGNISRVLSKYGIKKGFISNIETMLKATNGSLSIIIGDSNSVKDFFLNKDGLEQHLEDNPAFFLPNSNGNHKIFINADYVKSNFFEEILTHELSHAMSVGALRATDAQLDRLTPKEASAYRDFQSAISSIYDTVKADYRANNLGKEYPYSLSNIEEFFAHAQSNPALRDRMSNIIIDNNTSALSRFFESIIHFFEKLGVFTGNTALEAFDNIAFKFSTSPEFHIFNAMALEDSSPLMTQNPGSVSSQVRSIYNGLNNLAKDHRLTSKKFMLRKLNKFYTNDSSGIPRAKYLNSDRVVMQKIADRIKNVSESDAKKEAISILTRMGGLHSSKHRIDNPKFWEEVSELNSSYEKMEDKMYESLFYSQFYNPATSSYPKSISNMSDQIDTFLSTAKFKFREATKQIKNDRFIKQSESLLRILGMNDQGIDIHDVNNEYNIGDIVFFRGKFFEALQDGFSSFPVDGKQWKWRTDLNKTADQNIKKFDKSIIKGLGDNLADFGSWVLTQSSGTPTILELMSIMEKGATPYQNTYGTQLFKEMEVADNKKERILDKSQKWIIDTQKSVYGRRWKRERNNRKFQTVQLTPSGAKPFVLTRGELYKKWMEFQSPRTRKKLGMWAKERGMSYAEGKLIVDKAIGQFPKDKEWAMKQLTEFYPMMARYIDTSFKKHTGLSIYGMVENYSPISVKGTVDGLEFDITDVGKQDMHFATVYNAHLKGVVEGGTIQNIDGDRVMENYRKRMSHFVGYADVAGEIHSLSVNNTFKEAMDNLYGRKFFTTFEKMSKSIISGGINQEVTDKVVVSHLIALSTVALSFNIASGVKQLLSLPAYPLDHPTGVFNWLKQFTNLPQVVSAIKDISNSQFIRTRTDSGFSIMDEALARADYSDWRKFSGTTNLIRLMGRLSLLPSRVFDAITVVIGSVPLYLENKKRYEKTMNKKAAKDKALIDISTFANTTQQTSRNFATSAIDRDKMGRLFTQFQQAEIMYLSKAGFSVFRAGKKLAGGFRGYSVNPDVKKNGAIWNYISNDGGANDIKRFATYYWILPVLFLWGSLGFDIGDEDEYEPEDEDKGMLYRLYERLGIDDLYDRINPKILAKIWSGSSTGFPVLGSLISLYTNKYIGGTEYEFNPSPALSMLEDMYDSMNKLVTKTQDASDAADDGSFLGDTSVFMEEFLPTLEDEEEFMEFMEMLYTPAALIRINSKLAGRAIIGTRNFEENKEEYGWLVASMLAVGATKTAVGLEDDKSKSNAFIQQLLDPSEASLEIPKTDLRSLQNSKK